MPYDTLANNKLLSEIEEIARLGSYETDLSTGTWKGSENFIRIFGLPKKKEYTEEEFQALVHPDDFEEVMQFFRECLEEQKDFNCEYRCIRPDGEVIYVNSRSHITYDENGSPLKVIGIKQDITATKIYEKKLDQMNKLIRKKDEILAEVVHDLRGPLTQIMMIASLLEVKLEDEDQDMFELLKETCETSESIVSEIIEIAELEDFSLELNKSVSDLNDIIRQSANCYKLKLKEKKIALNTSFSPDATAFVDRNKMLRMVDNLLNNAIKFTPKGNAITLSTRTAEDSVTLIIEDEGIGIKEEHVPLLFDEESRPIRRQGTDGEHSTGLGLNIVKQIVDLHKGKVQASSIFGEGSTFKVTLPRNLPGNQE